MKIKIPKKHLATVNTGFSLVELVIVVAVIGVLSMIVVTNISGSREKAYRSRADSEILTMVNATKMYASKYNAYPADTERNIPAGLSEYISVDNHPDEWPDAPWPGSVYDYDAWDLWDDTNNIAGVDGVDETIQISVRFCPASGPADLSDCATPKESWTEGFQRKSSYYYCIKGYCRAHKTEPVTYKGYCVNCADNAGITRPDGT